MTISGIGWALNMLAFLVHFKWADKDPTHEDHVILGLLAFLLVPFLLFGIVALEIIVQKIFNIHHGVKRK